MLDYRTATQRTLHCWCCHLTAARCTTRHRSRLTGPPLPLARAAAQDQDEEEAGRRPSSRPIRPLVYRNSSTALQPDRGPSIEYKPKQRPPLAGPYAFFTIPPPFYQHRRVNVVKDPPNTWIFKDIRSAG